jgi:hypothetical protein
MDTDLPRVLWGSWSATPGAYDPSLTASRPHRSIKEKLEDELQVVVGCATSAIAQLALVGYMSSVSCRETNPLNGVFLPFAGRAYAPFPNGHLLPLIVAIPSI